MPRSTPGAAKYLGSHAVHARPWYSSLERTVKVESEIKVVPVGILRDLKREGTPCAMFDPRATPTLPAKRGSPVHGYPPAFSLIFRPRRTGKTTPRYRPRFERPRRVLGAEATRVPALPRARPGRPEGARALWMLRTMHNQCENR
jgi:hypothetical protein